MVQETGAGLPALLRLLSNHPDGSRVATSMNEGAFAAFGAQATAIWLLMERDVLTLVGYTGFADEELARWHQIPMSYPSQMVDVVRSSQVIVTPSLEFTLHYPNAVFDRKKYMSMMTRFGGGDLVGLPVVHQGLCLGVVQFVCSELRRWTSLDFSVLDGISSVLGLWATHPDTPMESLYTRSGRSPMLILSERQKQIIDLVLQGAGNHQISRDLMVSVSTVKQDLQKVMRATHQTDRLAAARCAVEMGLITPPPRTR